MAIRWPFNKVGMVNGHVETISPDAAELPDTRERDRKDTREHVMPPSGGVHLLDGAGHWAQQERPD